MPTHPTHDTRISDASSYDEICDLCGTTDRDVGLGLRLPCPKFDYKPCVEFVKAKYPHAAIFEEAAGVQGLYSNRDEDEMLACGVTANAAWHKAAVKLGWKKGEPKAVPKKAEEPRFPLPERDESLQDYGKRLELAGFWFVNVFRPDPDNVNNYRYYLFNKKNEFFVIASAFLDNYGVPEKVVEVFNSVWERWKQ